MKRSLLTPAAVLVLGLAASNAYAPSAGVRGFVVDDQGKPLPEVKMDMEFLGETRQKITKSQMTDKKGGFVRMGIPDGKWKITFTKEGYKTYIMEIHLSLGGFSEVDPPVVMQTQAATASATSAEPAAAVLPAGKESDHAGATYAKAVEAAQAGRLDEAEPLLKEVVAQFPNLAPAHYNLAYVYQKKKDWKGAEGEYVRVTELEPMKSDAFIALAAVRELDGRGQEAVEAMLAAAPSFEQDGKFQYALGMTCLNAGKTAEGQAAFQKAAQLDPGNPEPVYQLATIAVGQNRTAEALGLLEKYIGMTGQVPANVETAKGLVAYLKKK